MLQCWHETPELRPTFVALKDFILTNTPQVLRLVKLPQPPGASTALQDNELRMKNVQEGDLIAVIEGRNDYYWWKGKNYLRQESISSIQFRIKPSLKENVFLYFIEQKSCSLHVNRHFIRLYFTHNVVLSADIPQVRTFEPLKWVSSLVFTVSIPPTWATVVGKPFLRTFQRRYVTLSFIRVTVMRPGNSGVVQAISTPCIWQILLSPKTCLAYPHCQRSLPHGR